ncbi:MAG: prolyl oligopeptidase family serine peptidase [Gemmatimonadales bacterium]|jgi:dipeptidyl aminopeptidase/acylaminoacyl peptidase
MPRRRLSGTLAVAVAVLTLAPEIAAQERFTLDQVLAAPFPSSLVAAPEGGAVAWVFNAEGARNIWIAVDPGYEARQLTPYADDDGQAISDLQWTPDGRTLVFVRGGAPNRRGELPNPWSLPRGVAREIWAIESSGGEPRLLAAGASPAVAPTGDGLAFQRSGGIWWIPLEGGEAEPLVQIRGGSGTLRWSPDGGRLAFVSSRGDHSFVGVYDRHAERITWLDPSVDRDVYPVWSPDGRRIAFARIPAARDPLPFGPQRFGQPWSIRVADVTSGTGREVWRADPGPGSVPRNVVAENQLWWVAGDRIVFPWEKDGWLHLYSVDAEEGDAELLTPGEFEVEYVAITPDLRSVIYNSNQDDIDRRHLWRVPVDGGRPTPLTSGAGIEWAPTPTADGRAIAFLRSDATHPARPAILIGRQVRDLAPTAIPDDFPSDALVVPQPVIFSAADGMPIHGQLFMPSDARPGDGRPAVLFFHGGSRRQMLLGFHYGGYYHNAYAFNQYLASLGFVVLSVNYRSGIGYGMEFREALGYGATGASEFNDVLGAGLYLRGHSEVDPSRIGLWGGSYGGYLTALGLARASDLFAAGVDFHGVHDWNVVINNFRPDYNPKEHPEFARVAFEASPMAAIGGWRSPVLLIHGDDDRNVPFSETVDLVAALRGQGVEFEQLVFPDAVHSFTTHSRWRQAYRASADFLVRHLER